MRSTPGSIRVFAPTVTVARTDLRAPIVLLALIAAGSLPFIVLSLFDQAGNRLVWDNVHWSVSAVGAAGASLLSIRHATGRARRIRLHGSAMLVLWMIATLAWAWMNLTGTTAVPSLADAAIIALAVPGIVILLTTIRGRLSRAEEAAVYLDAALCLLFVGALIIYVFGPTTTGLPTAVVLASLGYPAAFIGLAAAGLVSWLAIGYPLALRSGFAMIVGSAILGLAYLGWLAPAISLTDPGELTSIMFTAGTLLAAYGVITWRDDRSTSPRYLAAARAATSIVGPLVASILFLLVLAPAPDEIEFPLHVAIFLASIAFVVRQALLLRERTAMLAEVTQLTDTNARLVDELREELRLRGIDQRRIVQASRAAAVGNLAAGVAHEVNNPLTGVLGFAELLILGMAVDDPRRSDVETIRSEALRARDILRSMRDFANPPPPELVPTDLSALVHQTVDLVRYSVEQRGTTIVEDLPGHDPFLLDGSAIQQAILNVLANARDATSEGGRIVVSSRADGDDRLITVVDDGVGMDDATASLAFDPFFTGRGRDRSVGLGAGLGLSVSSGLIESHGGTITISSRPGRGTTVEIRLPLARPTGDPEGGRGDIP